MFLILKQRSLLDQYHILFIYQYAATHSIYWNTKAATFSMNQNIKTLTNGAELDIC